MAEVVPNKRRSEPITPVKVIDLSTLATEKTALSGKNILVQVNTTVQTNLDVPLSTRASEATLLNLTTEVQFKNKLLQVDSVGLTTYLGYADAGTVTSAATWAVKKIVETGNDVSITWADGDKSFDNIWDDRLTLTYV